MREFVLQKKDLLADVKTEIAKLERVAVVNVNLAE